MHVLIFSPFFHPESISTGRYNTVLAQELVRRGASVEVFASHPLYPGWRPTRSDEQLPGMMIHRGGAWLYYPPRQALRRFVLEGWYTAYVAWNLVWKRPRADRIVVVFPPMLLAIAVRWLGPRGVPVVGIIHDLQGVMARGGWLRSVVRWLEQRALRACARLVFLSHSMQARAVSDYRLDAAGSVVRYPFLTLATPQVPGTELADVLPAGYIHVVYSGALGEKQEPEKLHGLMRVLASRDPRLRCHIFSAGPRFEQLRLAAGAANNGVAFHPLVDEGQLGELYARSAIQIIPQASGTSDGAIPSKLPNLLAAGVPVFIISDEDSEAALLIKRAGDAAGCHAGEFDGEETFARFDGFLEKVRNDARADRIRRQRPFVDQSFGVSPVVGDILGC